MISYGVAIGVAVDEEEEDKEVEEEVTRSDVLADCEGHFGRLGADIEESIPSSSRQEQHPSDISLSLIMRS